MRRLTLSVNPSAGTTKRSASYRRVLLAVDFGTPSLEMASWVAEKLLPDAELVVAHVLRVPQAPVYLRSQRRATDAFVREVREPMLAGLESLAATFGERRTRLELAVGDPATELARLAADHAVDLVVVGRPESRTHAAAAGGNTVERLLRRIRVPVLQGAAARSESPRSVVVAMDGRPEGSRVIAGAVEMTSCQDAILTALHVIPDDVRAYVRAMEVVSGSAFSAGAAEAALRSSAASYLGAELSAAGFDSQRSRMMVGVGDPGAEVISVCARANAELLVVGRSGADITGNSVVGSTTRYVLREAPCPVLVVPPAAAGPTLPQGRTSRKNRVAQVVQPPVSILVGTASSGDVAHRDDYRTRGVQRCI